MLLQSILNINLYIDNFFFWFLLYFFATLFSTLFRKKLSYKGIFFILTLCLGFIIVFLFRYCYSFIFYGFEINCTVYNYSVNWFFLDLNIELTLDTLSYCFTLLVSVIGFCTNIYVLNYFKYEANEDIFSLLLNWFIFSMILLVLAGNFFTLFLGWESIGLVSFFLINFWNTRTGTLKSSFKALAFNRVSDFFLFIFIVGIASILHTNDIALFNLTIYNNNSILNPTVRLLTYFLFCCTLFKSAQLLGHLWLPDSMEAPVPASALIHSATLVSAGIYLLMRFSTLINLIDLSWLTCIVGSITAAYGGIVSASQTDMKKLLAYSTISHCGFLFVTLSLNLYLTTIIYLFLHGLFKASTFYCAGSFIRVSASQDTRHMGSLSRILPVDTLLILLCIVNLGGLPFSIGYLYKSIFLISLLNSNTNFMCIGFVFIGLVAGLVYSFRLVYYACFDIIKAKYLPLIYKIQQKQLNCVNYWSLTTYIQLIATTFIIIFSIFFMIFVYTYFFKNELIVLVLPVLWDNSFTTLTFINTLYYSFYEMFYNIYIFIFIILYTVFWRVEFTFLTKINFFYFINLVIFFSLIFSYNFNFFSIICEVIFWQKLQHGKTLILVFLVISRKY